MRQDENVTDYLRTLYRDAGGDPDDIVEVIDVPMGAKMPVGYRVVRRDGESSVVWRRYIDQDDVERICLALQQPH